MADNSSTTIDFDLAESAIQTWNSAVGSFEPQKASSEPTLQALSAAGLESGFMASYDKNFDAAKEQIANFATDIQAVIQEFKNADEHLEKKRPKTPGGGSDPEDTQTHTDEELEALQLAEYEKLSLENLDGITEELIKLAAQEGVTLDKLLSDEAYQEKLSNLLATSKFVPEDLKKLILESDKVSQKVLLDITSGKYPSVIGLDDNTKKIYYNYLSNIANANDITLDKLLNDDQYKDLLKKSFTTFSSVVGELKGLNDDQIVAKLKKIKDGELEGIDRDAADVLREYAELDEKDQVASTKQAGKFGVFAKMNEKSSDKASKGTVSSLYKDYNPNPKDEEVPITDTEVPQQDEEVPGTTVDTPVEQTYGDEDVPTSETQTEQSTRDEIVPTVEASPTQEDDYTPIVVEPEDETVPSVIEEAPVTTTEEAQTTSEVPTVEDTGTSTRDIGTSDVPQLEDFGDENVPIEETGEQLTQDEDVPM